MKFAPSAELIKNEARHLLKFGNWITQKIVKICHRYKSYRIFLKHRILIKFHVYTQIS